MAVAGVGRAMANATTIPCSFSSLQKLDSKPGYLQQPTGAELKGKAKLQRSRVCREQKARVACVRSMAREFGKVEPRSSEGSQILVRRQQYSEELFKRIGRKTWTMQIGGVTVGNANPIRVQTMTTTDTMDVKETVEQVESKESRVDAELEKDAGLRYGKILALSSLFLQAGGLAFAKEDITRFTPDEWVNIYITTAVAAVLYLFVLPLIIYNYLRLRWYKRSTAETYFQFLLVFIFFPGLLLLAPFINFRRLPKDGTEPP